MHCHGSITFLIKGRLSDEVVGLNLQERGHHVLVNLHYDAQVVEIAIVCGREDCHEVPTGKKLVAVFLHLVCATNQVQVIFVVEVLDDYFTESVGDASVILAPIDHIFFGVGRI